MAAAVIEPVEARSDIIPPGVQTYTELAPSGIFVVSTVPFVEDKWWDRPSLHLIWSYASWVSMILVEYGHPGMRRALARRGWWTMPKEARK